LGRPVVDVVLEALVVGALATECAWGADLTPSTAAPSVTTPRVATTAKGTRRLMWRSMTVHRHTAVEGASEVSHFDAAEASGACLRSAVRGGLASSKLLVGTSVGATSKICAWQTPDAVLSRGASAAASSKWHGIRKWHGQSGTEWHECGTKPNFRELSTGRV
jgi:hypothetical protein